MTTAYEQEARGTDHRPEHNSQKRFTDQPSDRSTGCPALVFRLMRLLPVLMLPGLFTCSPSASLHTYTGRTMGTTFSVKIVLPARPASPDPSQVNSAIDSLLLQVNQQMSTYIPDSELSRFNASSSTDWFAVSADLAYVMQRAKEIYQLSGGAFDVTVGPLVNLWGFGPDPMTAQIPADEAIRARRKLTGSDKIHVRLQPPALRKELPGMYCDLSAIAKGFGVDKVADYLYAAGFTDFLVEIGGEVRARGHNQHGAPWRIGVASPSADGGVRKILDLQDAAMATSGDYFNYFEKDGVRYSHTIDPRTGRPITHTLASVTVIQPTCMDADALATAINVLGPEQGMRLAEEKNWAVFMIIHDGSAFIEKMTAQFQQRFIHENQ